MDFWANLVKWWDEASKKVQVLADAKYKEELAQARTMGDDAVAAVQARWTVRSVIENDAGFDGDDKRNLALIEERVVGLSPKEQVEFYQKLGATLFVASKQGYGEAVSSLLSDLAKSPKDIAAWSRGWASGAGARVSGQMRNVSIQAGRSQLEAMSRQSPQIGPPRGSSKPATPYSPTTTPIGWDSVFSVGLSIAGAGFDIRSLPQESQSLASLVGADIFLDGTKKTLDHQGYGLAVWQLGVTYQSIGESSLSTAGKWAAYATETVATAGSVIIGTVGTVRCTSINKDPVMCAVLCAEGGEGFSIALSGTLRVALGVDYKRKP